VTTPAPLPSRSGAARRRLSEDERRAQIVAAATQELAERGYDDASLTRIAARAGVAKGLVWHYFSGKGDLMEATAKMTMAAFSDHITGLLDLTRPVPDIIRSALRHVAALTVTHRAELIALDHIVHNLRGPDGVARVTQDYYETTLLAQESLFRRGQEEGSLRDFGTRTMAIAYQGSIEMMLGHLRAHPDIDPNDVADELAQILLGGIRQN
jgi:AcrR family transcriptional regulator